MPSSSEADHDYLPEGASAVELADAAVDVGKQVTDRRSARRKAGHGYATKAGYQHAPDEHAPDEHAPDAQECLHDSQLTLTSCRRRARRRKPTRVSRGILPPQGDELMHKANTEFMLGNYAEALPHLMECIKRYPNFTEPWMSLAATFENMKLHERALHSYAIALHMKPSDDNIAKLCAEMSMSTVPLHRAHTIGRIAWQTPPWSLVGSCQNSRAGVHP